jgi:hypothetical protein
MVEENLSSEESPKNKKEKYCARKKGRNIGRRRGKRTARIQGRNEQNKQDEKCQVHGLF